MNIGRTVDLVAGDSARVRAPANLLFLIPTEQRGIRIDITDSEKLQQDFIPLNDAQQQLLQSSAAWPVGKLVDWVDRAFAHPALTEAETGIYLTRAIGKLKNGKSLAVEYKGLDRATNDDTKEKERLGQLWEARSEGQCIFLMIKGPDQLSRISDAVAKA